MDGKEEIIDKIRNISKKEFQIIETKKDGNCLFYSFLKSIKERIAKHTELRQIVYDYIENDDYEVMQYLKKKNAKLNMNILKNLGEMENMLMILL